MIIKKSLINVLKSPEPIVWFRQHARNYSSSIDRTIKIGSKASLSKVFTQSDVEQFASLSMDNNELHLNESAARRSGFEKQIVHGILVNGLVSAILGTILPGKGSILISEQISFLKPVHVDRKVEIEVEVIKMTQKMNKTFYECEFKGFVENPTNTDLHL